ncbi:MAG: mechanosensitive ion channel [Gemmatimonadota bacterium]|nr:mechanosensitive ion channel [Gemmatimonadota bacterium]
MGSLRTSFLKRFRGGSLLLLVVAAVSPGPLEAQAPPEDLTESQTDTVDSASTASPEAPEQITAERSGTDENIRNTLQAVFDRVPSLARVSVTVEAGIVGLSGVVLDATIRERAVELASEQEGVVWVENDIVLDTSLSRQLAPTWGRLRQLGFDFLARLPLLLVALVIMVLSMALGAALGKWGGPPWLRSDNPFLRNLVARAIQLAVVLAGLLVALDLLDATALVGAVAGTAGLAGLALGFAFKDIVENYLAGLLLALQRPFEKNDHVVVESHQGKVVRLTPRETILMTPDGNHIRLPNAVVFRSPMLNYTRNPRRRFQFDAGIGPVDDLALAREAGQEVLREMEGVLDDPPPQALVMEIGESWVTVRFMGWVDQRESDFGRVRSEAIRLVKLRLEAAGVSLPSPEYLVRFEGAGADAKVGAAVAAAVEEAPQPAAPDFQAADVRSQQADVSRDDSVDRQIAEDRLQSQEEDLLEGQTKKG